MNLNYIHYIDKNCYQGVYPELPWVEEMAHIYSNGPQRIVYEGVTVVSFDKNFSYGEFSKATDNFFKNMIRKQKLEAL